MPCRRERCAHCALSSANHDSHDPQVAVHCHAGLGRTGVLLACYLVYYLRYLHSTIYQPGIFEEVLDVAMQLLSDIYFQRYPWGTICNLTDIRVRSNDAIRYVRLKRPNMVQTRRQIQCVKEFETYFLPQVKSFPIRFFPVCNQTISPKIFIFSASCTAQNPQMSEIKSSADFRSRPA